MRVVRLEGSAPCSRRCEKRARCVCEPPQGLSFEPPAAQPHHKERRERRERPGAARATPQPWRQTRSRICSSAPAAPESPNPFRAGRTLARTRAPPRRPPPSDDPRGAPAASPTPCFGPLAWTPEVGRPRTSRGYSVETSRGGCDVEMPSKRAAATWRCRRNESRRRRGCEIRSRPEAASRGARLLTEWIERRRGVDVAGDAAARHVRSTSRRRGRRRAGTSSSATRRSASRPSCSCSRSATSRARTT